jgi:hypothetical protein
VNGPLIGLIAFIVITIVAILFLVTRQQRTVDRAFLTSVAGILDGCRESRGFGYAMVSRGWS